MTQKAHLPWNSVPTQKSICCQLHLRPLVERIQQLELRLGIQTERRQNEFNELLKKFITGRRQSVKEDGCVSGVDMTVKKRLNSSNFRKLTSPSSRKMTAKLPLKKNTERGQGMQEAIKITDKRGDKMAGLAVSLQIVCMQRKMNDFEEAMGRQQSELDKVRELNDYLMEQLLGVFQKVRQIQQTNLQQKRVQSQQTVPSVVFDTQFKESSIKIVNKQNNSSSRISINDLSKAELSQIAAKVTDHQNMLSDLIQLTRALSSQIKHLPPEWASSSPQRQ